MMVLLLNYLEFVDKYIEVYLGKVIKPFLELHEKFYSALNKTLRSILDNNKSKIPDWFTANFITYFRTIVVVPTLLLLALGHHVLPSILVILVDFGDFLDGVVARFWVDIKKEKLEQEKKKKNETSSPTNSDDESFEIVTTGSSQTLQSWQVLHLNRTYGGFIDAVCDKAYVVPCWISLLSSVPGYPLAKIQYVALFFLILAEVASGCIRFKAYFSSVAVPSPKVEGFDFSTSAVKADHVGKAKQTFEMVGTALFIVPVLRYFGLVLLLLAMPLAYESVKRKINTRVMYVTGCSDDKQQLDHKTLKFWMQVKSMGSKLVVGFPHNKTDMILNACACSCVDEVVAEAPEKLDIVFLEKHGIDYVVLSSSIGGGGQPKKLVTDEVLNDGRCFEIGADGVARPAKSKAPAKEE